MKITTTKVAETAEELFQLLRGIGNPDNGYISFDDGDVRVLGSEAEDIDVSEEVTQIGVLLELEKETGIKIHIES